jgi:hypothetical protein
LSCFLSNLVGQFLILDQPAKREPNAEANRSDDARFGQRKRILLGVCWHRGFQRRLVLAFNWHQALSVSSQAAIDFGLLLNRCCAGLTHGNVILERVSFGWLELVVQERVE